MNDYKVHLCSAAWEKCRCDRLRYGLLYQHTMMKFKVFPLQEIEPERSIYRPEDYSFDVERRSESGIVTLLVNDLQLKI